jgi:lysozyme family protein
MADFRISYKITKNIEGGYHNGQGDNAHDKGGETFKGIARKFWPNWPGWTLIDALKSSSGFPGTALESNEIQELVLAFYKKEFWDVNNLDQVRSQAIANEVFDTGVNMGTRIAAIFLQRSVNYLNRDQRNFRNISIDGAIGPISLTTVNRLNQVDTRHLFNLMNILQGSRYIDIIDRDTTQEVFIRGWLERVEQMRSGEVSAW